MQKDIGLKHLYLISCVGEKRQGWSGFAKDLYISEWFKKAYSFARERFDANNARFHKHTDIFILSAKYHAVNHTDHISTYDKTLSDMSSAERKAWAQEVFDQLNDGEGLAGVKVTILAGDLYRAHLIPMLLEVRAIVDVPMVGLGIGQQLSYLKSNTKGGSI